MTDLLTSLQKQSNNTQEALAAAKEAQRKGLEAARVQSFRDTYKSVAQEAAQRGDRSASVYDLVEEDHSEVWPGCSCNPISGETLTSAARVIWDECVAEGLNPKLNLYRKFQEGHPTFAIVINW